MSKYNFDLDMNSDNSNSVILRNIRRDVSVLEVGSAHGRMTKYLKDNLNCAVDIVEPDLEAGTAAAQWASNAYVDTVGNIEDYTLNHLISIQKLYDVVIYADVLEHLKDPERVLSDTKSVLKPGGSVWISIPNVAYNGIICELLNDKFTYRDTGLLDKTHIKFFTHESLSRMVKSTGYEVAAMYNLKNAVNCSEFKGAYDIVPAPIANYLKSRKYGEVYQFVWELKINE